MWQWHDMGWGGGGWLTVLLTIVVVVALIVAVVFLIRALVDRNGSISASEARGPARPSPQETPEQILKRRYAAGEIDREEYLAKLKDLRP